MQAALLTIGSEITSGEIVNTNAVWMSEQLEAMGFQVAVHLSVPDESKLIQWALNQLMSQASLILISGGLGPTSDDITRQEVASVLGRKLIFHDDVWQALCARFAARGVPIRESHRQQCYFQEGAVLLPNVAGTALGFYIQEQQKHFFVLPGPPRELEPMWANEVVPRMDLLPRSRDFAVRRWVVENVPESEVAEVVEEVMKGLNVVLGYRASKPIVRVKVRYQLSDAVAVRQLEVLDQRLRKWIKA